MAARQVKPDPMPRLSLVSDSSGEDANAVHSNGNTRSVRSLVFLSVVGIGLVAAGYVAGRHAASVAALTTPQDHDSVIERNGLEEDSSDKDSKGTHGALSSNDTCSADGADCSKSTCCLSPGKQCYKKNDFFSTCLKDCIPGRHPTDADSHSWDCTELGDRTAGEVPACSDVGKDCRGSKCCNEPGMTCFAKNKSFATCKADCTPGPNALDADWHPWSCDKLGSITPVKADWVDAVCAHEGENCIDKKCCADSGKQCYKQSEYYGKCMRTCTEGKDPKLPWAPAWSCDTVGLRTPADSRQAILDPSAQIVSKWVQDRCAWDGDNCVHSQCCVGADMQCWQLNSTYGTCMDACTSGQDFQWDTVNITKAWCKPLGSRGMGLALRGFPSLFCATLFRKGTYEHDIMKETLKHGIGIFACDEYMVLATESITLGEHPWDHVNVTSHVIPNIPVGRSQDGTAANTELFIAVWNKICENGVYKNHHWTVKVDPDAVLIPNRLRKHMAMHTGVHAENGGKLYVVNCNAYPNSANFPMVYGALEILSMRAMLTYANEGWKCKQNLPWHAWGEDFFLTHCMDMLGVGRIGDYEVLGDNLCTGSRCDDGWTAAFHPYKDIGSWMNCLAIAHNEQGKNKPSKMQAQMK